MPQNGAFGDGNHSNSIASRQRRPLDYEAELSESEQNNVAARLKHDDTPEATVLSEEIRQTVNAAIEQLPEDLRTALSLREFDGLSYEEIADLIVYLCSDYARHISGQIIGVDGNTETLYPRS